MANGWAPDGAAQNQIEDTLKAAVLAARARMPSGESAIDRDDCGEPILEKRRSARPDVRTCVPGQVERDRKPNFTKNHSDRH